MKMIIYEINKAVGEQLRKLQLTAVYDQSTEIELTDDAVKFVSADGQESVVQLSINSRNPSLASATVDVSHIAVRDLGVDGWKFATYDAMSHFDHDVNNKGLFVTLGEQLQEHGRTFDLTAGFHDKVMTHPLAPEALDHINKFSAEWGFELEVKPFVAGNESRDEGFDLVTADGTTTVKVAVLPGAFSVTTPEGEPIKIQRRDPECAAMISSLLLKGFQGNSPKP